MSQTAQALMHLVIERAGLIAAHIVIAGAVLAIAASWLVSACVPDVEED